NPRGLEMAQHADALLDAPSIGGGAGLLDHRAVELLERLTAKEEPAGGGGEGGPGPNGGRRGRGRGGGRGRRPRAGPRARLADDGDVHAASAVARSSRCTPCRKMDRANSKSATTRPEVMNERACESVSRVSKWSSPTRRANSSANSRMSSLSRARSAATSPSSTGVRP